jgi:hypothetical protein
MFSHTPCPPFGPEFSHTLLKPGYAQLFTARLKSCADTKPSSHSDAKARFV